jgi:hypothetical protein
MMSKVAEMKEALRKSTTTDDFIKALFSEVKTNKIKKDPSAIHEAIYNLKRIHKDDELFNNFYFDCSGISPFSDLLDRILFRLETASVLGAINPRYLVYELMTETKEYLKKESLEKFEPAVRENIKLLSEEFEGMVEA